MVDSPTENDREAVSSTGRPNCPNCDDGHMVACGVSVKWWECAYCGTQRGRSE